MMKLLITVWQVLVFLWRYIKPIYSDMMRIIAEVNATDLDDDEARKKVFQDVTDAMQARGLQKIPDSVLNCAIELGYQICMWRDCKTNQGGTK
jgi:hypothetical protein